LIEDLAVVKKTRASESIVRQMLDLISSGKWRPADRLPSERELMQHLGVGRTSIREALRVLEALDCIEVRHGEGSFVKSGHGLMVTDSMIDTLIKDSAHLLMLYEVREMLEPKAAFQAAQRREAGQLKELESIVVQLEEAAERDDLSLEVQLDFDFHLAVASTTGNDLLFEFERVVLKALQASWVEALKLPDRPKINAQEVRAIYEAIRLGRAKQAETLSLHHVHSGRETGLARFRKTIAAT
jgi:GntR family transcriptional repressor for pyruvate dehydrogenase complex